MILGYFEVVSCYYATKSWAVPLRLSLVNTVLLLFHEAGGNTVNSAFISYFTRVNGFSLGLGL